LSICFCCLSQQGEKHAVSRNKALNNSLARIQVLFHGKKGKAISAKEIRGTLKNNWGRAIFALLLAAGIAAILAVSHQIAILMIVPLAEDYVSLSVATFALFFVFMLLDILVSPVHLGALKLFWSLAAQGDHSIAAMFCFFDSAKAYLRMVWYFISMSARAAGWALIFYSLPTAALAKAVFTLRSQDDSIPPVTAMVATAGLVFSVLLLLLVSILFIIHMHRYALAHLLLFEDENLKVRTAIKISVEYMRGYKVRMLMLSVKLLGWVLLTLITFGAAYLYAGPYIHASYALFGRLIIDENRYVAPDATKKFTVA